MKDPNDTRDTGPKVGSPLWIHMALVIFMGTLAVGLAVTGLGLAGVHHLSKTPAFWEVAALIVVGEMRPIITPGRSGTDSPVVSLAFSFAALLFWGFGVAALLRVLSIVFTGVAQRRAPHRIAFNAAQTALSLGAAGLVLWSAGLHPAPDQPGLPGGRTLPGVALAAVAYFAVNYLLVSVAVALHSRTPWTRMLRTSLAYQAFANFVLLSAAPLVVVVVSRSPLLLILFLLPLAAIYANAQMAIKREYQANHDELTGLSNRQLLIRKSGEALAAAARSGATVGFLLLDLDRFKEVNDTLGHPVGDDLLRFVAHRLTHSIRPGDVVARLGGDEFAVLLPSVREVGAAREVASRLRVAIAEPIRLEGMSFEIEASVGLALYPDDASGFELLMQHADVAMYLAKERRSGVERYAADCDRNSPARLALLGDLRRGIDRGELELHYQPKVYLGSRQTAGVEALVRWNHPVRGQLPPEEFIPLVEQSYLMRDLTAHVVTMALDQAAMWWRDGLPVQMALNVAARDLLDTSLAESIARGLARTGLPPAALLLEISERMLTAEPAPAAASMEALAALGVALSLDDFGTGYSSLVRLRRLPVGEVKIDSSFVGRLLDSADDEVIVRSIIDLVRALGMRSVAEGVESAEVAAALAAMGCDAAQGWHFARPLSAAAASEWLAEHGVPALRPAAEPVVRVRSVPRSASGLPKRIPPGPASPPRAVPGPTRLSPILQRPAAPHPAPAAPGS
jgi:diguanylate cyclase (GGDEF)-like protein